MTAMPRIRTKGLAVCLSLFAGLGHPGIAFAAPWIETLSATTETRSGYIEVVGSGFGSDGEVLIDGLAAPVATWTDGRIAAYVPEAARLGPVPIEVSTTDGFSNVAALDVTERVAEGRVKWRLRMDALYSRVRPAIAPDGTVYAVDLRGRLYALAPDGALKWLVRGAGAKGVAVGPDGTVYTASEGAIQAFFPDGVERWTFVQDPRAFILVGMAVGPDGNIYAVASSGMGVFSLSPDGFERWRTPEVYSRPNVSYGEIAFGPGERGDQLYFYANAHLRSVTLKDARDIFTVTGNAPVVSPLDGTVHYTDSARAPDGTLLWQFAFPVLGVPVSQPDVAPDGRHYVVHGGTELFVIGPDGFERNSALLAKAVGRPIVDPLNGQVVMGGAETLDNPGFVQALDVKSLGELWRVTLPAEATEVYNIWTGQFGFNQFVDTPARFAADGQTAYLHTAIATGGIVPERAFLYAFDAGGSGTATDGGGTTTDGGDTTTDGGGKSGKGWGKGGKSK